MHRTVVEDEHPYAVRIDDGALLDAADQIDQARPHLDEAACKQAAAILGCEPERLDRELDTLAARAKTRALKLRITSEERDRARNGRYAFAHDRGQDFAAAIWVVDPAFMLDLVHEQLIDADATPAREDAYFAGARIDDDELRDAAAEDEQRRTRARARHADATRSNLGLGHDIRAGTGLLLRRVSAEWGSQPPGWRAATGRSRSLRRSQRRFNGNDGVPVVTG